MLPVKTQWNLTRLFTCENQRSNGATVHVTNAINNKNADVTKYFVSHVIHRYQESGNGGPKK